MKTLKSLIALILLTIAFVACSPDDSDTVDTDPVVEVVEEQEGTEETTEEEEEEETVTYSIGDTGPAGGFILYDKGEFTDGWQYIEVAPENLVTDAQWGCVNSAISGAQSNEIGAGLANSEAILEFHNSLDNYYENPEQCWDNNDGSVAAKLALEYSLNGFDNWHLPSRDEGILFYTNLHVDGIGNFDGNLLYWSSTEHSGDPQAAAALLLDPIDSPNFWGWSGKNWNQDIGTFIRPVRYF